MATKHDLILELSKSCNKSQTEMLHILDALQAIICEKISKGEKISWMGFLSIDLIYKAEYQARNPKTGEAVTVPSGYRVKVKAGKSLEDAAAQSKK